MTQDEAPRPDPAYVPRREEDFAQSHSADTGEFLFSATAGAPGAPAVRDRLAEAVEVMTRIRSHGQWESAQTHDSLLPYLIEESWELVDAVADGDRDELVSELGDLLLQVLFHAAIGAERTERPFDIDDVAGALLDKLRRRAPYWFDDERDEDDDDNAATRSASGVEATAPAAHGPSARGPAALVPTAHGPAAAGIDAAEQDRLWQEAKAAERAGRPPRGVVDGISWDMPALALGQKVLERVRSAGIPDDLVPAEMRVVRVESAGVFRGGTDGDSGSAEVEYRQIVRRFADVVREAESRLPVPTGDATAADWHTAWPH